MDNNDFLGSYAQENVAFTTRVIRTAKVGDNFYQVMMFVESSRFVEASSVDWVQVPGSSTLKALTVTASDYAEYTTGLLRSWLYDLLSISTSVTNNYFEKRTYGVRITVAAPVSKHLNILGIGGVNPTF